MSRELLNVNNTYTIKQDDDSTTIILSAHDDNEPKIFKPGDIGTIHISTSKYHIPSIPAKLIIGSNNVNINSADLVNLPAGKYSLELWVSQKDGPKTTIYPSSGSLALTIDKNADDLTDKTLTTLTLDDLRKDLHDDVADAVKHVKIDPSAIDLSDYAKKSDVPAVTLDVNNRTLTIDKQTIDIPNNVDLSGYAKSEDVPNVKYNSQTKTLTVNGVTVEIPSTVDLSNYYTKSQIDDKLASAVSGGKVDLSGYVKTEQLNDYAKKTDVPSVVYDSSKKTLTINGVNVDLPDNVDLSDYVRKEDTADFAKKSDIPTVPVIALDTAKRTLTVNGNVINIPNSVDLSGYVKVDQLSDYARKSDIPASPDLSEYAKKSDIKAVDLTPYITKAAADAKYATKADVENVKAQKGDRGTMIYSTNAQLSSKMMAMSVSIAALNQTTPTPRAGDYLIANIDSQTAISTITKVDSSDVYISSSYVNLQGVAGPSGSNGHSIWVCQGSSSGISINASQLLNYQQYSILQPEIGDLVVGSDGTISSITYSYGDPLVINTGSALATIKAQSDTSTKDTPYNYAQYQPATRDFVAISKTDLPKYLNITDTTKSYELDVDTGKIGAYGITPGIYPMRDTGLSNFSVKSGSNYDGLTDKPYQILQYEMRVEYAKIMYLTTDLTVHYAVRPVWSADNYSEYYGSHYAWHEI